VAPVTAAAAQRAQDSRRSGRRVAAVMKLTSDRLLLVASAAALAALPPGPFPREWLLAFTAPGLLFAILAVPPIQRRLGFEARLGIALLGQLALTALAVTSLPPLRIHHALTLNLISPLVFLSLRRRPGSTRLALFLGLCIVWIGLMAARDPDLVPVVVFAVAGTLALHAEARREAVAGTDQRAFGRPAWWRAVLARVGLVAGTLCLAIGMLPALRLLPAPGRALRDGSASIGVPTEFELDRAGRGPLTLQSDQLLFVERTDGRPPPDDLYLRGGAFEIAAFDAWRAAPGEPMREADGKFDLPPSGRGTTVVYRVTHLAPTAPIVFVPAGALRVEGSDAVLVDRRRGLVQTAIADPVGPFTVVAVRGAQPEAVDRRDAELRALPPELREHPQLGALADELRRRAASSDPFRLATVVARALQQRCRYRLTEPTGPYGHALENFLFGNRTGYCMHFASAAAVLLRRLGVPCRIAVGLYGGQVDVDFENARIFGSRDAHAWVEVPLRGGGYAIVDPTPPSDLAPQAARWPSQRSFDAVATGGDEPITIDALLQPVSEWIGAHWPWFALLLLLAILHLRPSWRRRPRRALPAAAIDAGRLLGRILAELAQAQRRRARGQTLEAYARQLDVDPDLHARLVAAFAAYQEVRFGAAPLDPARVARLDDGHAAARGLATQRRIVNG
jgi:hypothetical protein